MWLTGEERALLTGGQRWYGIDYRDRWRHDDHGVRRLTLRRLHALIGHLPREAALWAARDPEGSDGPLWRLEHFLLDAVRVAVDEGNANLAKKKADIKPHPASPLLPTSAASWGACR